MKDIKDTDERRNEFIDAAEKLFKENGIVDTTINAIVKEMDVAKGLLSLGMDLEVCSYRLVVLNRG